MLKYVSQVSAKRLTSTKVQLPATPVLTYIWRCIHFSDAGPQLPGADLPDSNHRMMARPVRQRHHLYQQRVRLSLGLSDYLPPSFTQPPRHSTFCHRCTNDEIVRNAIPEGTTSKLCLTRDLVRH